jgi:hypothetical protein
VLLLQQPQELGRVRPRTAPNWSSVPPGGRSGSPGPAE